MQDTMFHEDVIRARTIDDFPRVKKLVAAMLDSVDEVCMERPTYWTEYRMSEEAKGKPRIVLQAEALRHVLRKRSTPIYDHELIVGGTTSKRSGGLVFPEFIQIMLWPELLEIETRRENPFKIEPEEVQRLNDFIFPFWMNENLLQNAKDIWNTRWSDASNGNQLDEQTRKYWNENIQYWNDMKPFEILEKFHFYLLSKANGISHLAADFNSVLEKGFTGISAEAEEKLDKLGNREGDDVEAERDFYRAVMISSEGIIDFAKNYAATARKMADATGDDLRKEELLKIAGVCEHVPAKPARNFHEAVQAMWFTQIGIHQENYDMGVSFGRSDQYLYRFYKKDIEEGTMTQDEALEILCCAWVKFTDHVTFTPATGSHFFGGTPSNQAMTIGGLKSDGSDAANDLTMLMMEASAIVKLREPNLSARFHRNSPDEYWKKAIETVKIHRSTPALYNDDVIVESLVLQGIEEEAARNYAVIGCVEATVDGETFGMTGAALVNLASAFQMALNNGYYPERDEQVGPQTGNPLNFMSFDELVRAYKRQVENLVFNVVLGNNTLGRSHQQLHPSPYLSSIVKGCIDKGKDVTMGGAKRNSSGVAAIGLADVADSLTAIEKLVFVDKSCTMTQMLEAVRNNFEGPEHRRVKKLVENLTYYGNYKSNGDSEMADKNANLVARIFCATVKEYKNYRGGKYNPGFWSMTCNTGFGNLMNASPNGRRQGEPFASGITARGSKDTHGLTRSLLSAAHIGTREISNTVALNERFDPDLTVDQVTAATKAYFFPDFVKDAGSNGKNGKGMQVQYTVADRKMLRDAQKNPGNYKDLSVRISGYTAYFVDLIEEVQEEIISRTTQLNDSPKEEMPVRQKPVPPPSKQSMMKIFFRLIDLLTTIAAIRKPPLRHVDKEHLSVKILLNVMTYIYEVVSRVNPADFNKNLDGFEATVQFKLRDSHRREFIGSFCRIKDNTIVSGNGIADEPEVTLTFKEPASFFKMMTGEMRQLDSLMSGDLSYQGILPYMARYGYISAIVQPYLEVLQDARKIDVLDEEGQMIALKVIVRSLVSGISETMKLDNRVMGLVKNWNRCIVFYGKSKLFLGGVRIDGGVAEELNEIPDRGEQRIEVHLTSTAADFKVLNLVGNIWQSLMFYRRIKVRPWKGLNFLRKIGFLRLLALTALYLKPALTDYDSA